MTTNSTGTTGSAPADDRDLSWELLLTAAAADRFELYARELGLSDFVSPLQDAARDFLSEDAIDTKTLSRRVKHARDVLRQIVGAGGSAELDLWVVRELAYPVDSTLHYIAAIDLLLRGAPESHPTPEGFGVPAWVPGELARDFHLDYWRSLFDFSPSEGPPNIRLNWEAVGYYLKSTVERRTFQSFWRDFGRRADPSALSGFRDWSMAILSRTRGPIDLPFPGRDGRFA